jgi:membrane protease subunit HflK
MAAIFVVGAAIAGLAWVGSFQVDPDEQVLVLRLGKHVRTVGPGFHFSVPVLEVRESRRLVVMREEFGFRTVSSESPQQYEEVPEERRMLTGDNNVVEVEFVVQYRIADLADYMFQVQDSRTVIRDVALAAMRDAVARRPIDDTLTDQRTEVAYDARSRSQEVLDAYRAGVEIQQVTLQDAEAPADVEEAFRDVVSAQQDQNRMILQAQGYADQVVPRARGEAQQLINEAEAYKQSRVLEARGEADRFVALLTEYRRSPDVTRERLYIETLERILPSMDKVIIEKGYSDQVVPYLPIGRRGKVE